MERSKRVRFRSAALSEKKQEAIDALEATASGVADSGTEDCEHMTDGAFEALAKLPVRDLIEVEAWLRKVREYNLKMLREKLED